MRCRRARRAGRRRAGAVRLALALRRPCRRACCSASGRGIAFLFEGFAGPAWLAITALLLVAFAAVAHARATRRPWHVALLVAAAARVAWPSRCTGAIPAHLRALVGRDRASRRFFGLRRRSPPVEPFYHCKNLPWFAWPALPLALWTLWTRGRGFNGGLATAGVAVARRCWRSCMLVEPVCCAGAARDIGAAAAGAAALLGAPEVDTLKRGFSGALDWFGILTFGLLALVVWALWIERCGTACRPSRSRAVPRHGGGLPADVPSGSRHRRVRISDPAVDRAGASGAAQQSARGAQLGRGRDAGVGPLLDDLAAVSRFAAQLSPGGRSAGAAAARADGCVASRNLGEPQRALFEYFARHRHRCATRSRRGECVSAAARAVRPRRHATPAAGFGVAKRSGKATGAATTPSVLLFRAPPLIRERTGSQTSMKFIDEAKIEVIAGDGGNGAVVVSPREVRAARRPGRRRRRPRRQHLCDRRSQHQHADRLSLRAHPSRQARRERPRRGPVRPRRRRHRAAHAGRHGDHRRRHRRTDRRSRRARQRALRRQGRQGRPRQPALQVEHQSRAAAVDARRNRRAAAACISSSRCWPTSACSACRTPASRR